MAWSQIFIDAYKSWRPANRILAWTAGALLVLISPAGAQQICGPAVAACDLQTDMACLERTYACGEYETVIETLFVEDFAPTLDQKFYIGASFFGRNTRERAAGVQCEMVKFAREYLSDYLSTAELEFSTTGSFGTMRQMHQLYQASQMLTDLGEIPGCPESALTRATIGNIARAEAVRYTKDVFLNPPIEARGAFDTLMLALRGFVSRASDLETGIALRRIEIRSAEVHLQAIRAVLEDVFGTVSGSGSNLAVDTSILDGLLSQTAAMLRDVEIQEAAFAAALGGVSAEQYAGIRAETVATAQDLLKRSAFHINMIGVLLPTDPARPFWRLDEAVHADNVGQQAFDDLAQIRVDWRAHGEARGICSQPGAAERVWFCR